MTERHESTNPTGAPTTPDARPTTQDARPTTPDEKFWLCEHLRHRNEQIPELWNELFVRHLHPVTVYYCAETLEGLGPDDGPVCPEECTPERSCFALSIRSPRR